MKLFHIFIFFNIFFEIKGEPFQCFTGTEVSETFISETTTESFCKDEEICRQITVTAQYIADSEKRYIAFGKCFSEDDIIGRCDDQNLCYETLEKALSGYVSSNTTFRGTRCSVRCKYSDGRGLGTNTGLSSRRFYITPDAEKEVESSSESSETNEIVSGSSVESSLLISGGTDSFASGISGTSSSSSTSASGSSQNRANEIRCKNGIELTEDEISRLPENICGKNQICQKVDLQIEYWNYSTNANQLHFSRCLERCLQNPCDQILKSYNFSLPEGSAVAYSSCSTKCCDSEICEGSASASGGPYFPELEVRTPVEFNIFQIPYLPGCSLNEADDASHKCLSLFMNGFPFKDQNFCRRSAFLMEKCFKNAARTCLYGSKPTVWDALGVYKPFSANWELKVSMEATETTDHLTLMCNNLEKVYSESDSEYIKVWLSLLPLDRNQLRLSQKQEELESLILESINTKSENTFCRAQWQINKLLTAYIKNLTKSAYKLDDVNTNTEPNIKYETFIVNYLNEAYKTRICAKCLAIQEVEHHLQSRQLNMGSFFTEDESGCTSYNMNLIFAIGVSKTMNTANFKYAKNIIEDISAFVDPTKHKLGFLQFSGRTRNADAEKNHLKMEIGLGSTASHIEFLERLNNSQVMKRRKLYIKYILEKIEKFFRPFKDSCSKEVLILITDSKYEDLFRGTTLTLINSLRKSNLVIENIKIGEFRKKQERLNHDNYFQNKNFVIGSRSDAISAVYSNFYKLLSDGQMMVSGG